MLFIADYTHLILTYSKAANIFSVVSTEVTNSVSAIKITRQAQSITMKSLFVQFEVDNQTPYWKNLVIYPKSTIVVHAFHELRLTGSTSQQLETTWTLQYIQDCESSCYTYNLLLLFQSSSSVFFCSVFSSFFSSFDVAAKPLPLRTP